MEIIKSGEWVELKVFTADLVKKTGGKILHLEKCRIARRKIGDEHGGISIGSTSLKRPANHNQNFTVNMEMENGLIRKIHPLLIFELNKEKVI